MNKASSLLGAALLAASTLGPARAEGTGPSKALIIVRQHMMDADINTLTFRSIDRMFETRAVANGGPVWKLKERPTKLDFTYTIDGTTIPAEAFAERTYTNALLILKNDRIVYEKYFNNADASTHFLSMSVAKSITSTLIGMAIVDGAIGSVEDPLVKYVPELKGTGYDGVTIRQALLMRSGVDWDERYDFGKESPMQMLHEAAVVENRIRFVEPAFSAKRIHAPGTAFNYSTVETAVLGLMLERAVKEPIEDYMSERFWQPAGMQSAGFWIADGPPGVGKAINGMGFNAIARDYARFGLMMLRGGKANGTRLLPAAWVSEATVPNNPEPVPESSMGYQYQWWTLTNSDAYTARGLQGQYVFVDPETNTVIVKLSYFPPGEEHASVETEAFLRAASKWQPN